MTFYKKHHPYDWMKGHLIKPETVEFVFGFLLLLIALIVFSYVVILVTFFVLKALGIIDAEFFQFYGGQGAIP